MSAYECNTASDLKAKGRGIQFIAKYLGRSMEDVARYLAPPTESATVPIGFGVPLLTRQNASGQKPRMVTEDEEPIFAQVEAGTLSARGAARLLKCAVTTVRRTLERRQDARDRQRRAA